MAESKTATFGIRIPTETNALDTANSVEALRARIAASQDAIKNYGSSLRLLKGSSDEVKEAKLKLRSAVDAEKDAVSRAALALGREGTTFEEATRKAKAHTKAIDDAKKKTGEFSGPLADAKAKVEGFATQMGSAEGAASLMAGAVAVAAAAVVAFGAAIIAGAIALGKFILEEGNALRTMSLFREAATGSATSALHFGHQIDALGAKIPTSREALNGLSVEMSKLLVGTRVSGQGIVDTFNAVAQESAAMGDSAGKQIQSIIERSKQFGRLGIGRFELQGTGVSRDDVATELAKRLHIGVAAARTQLALGRVAVDDGAAALRAAVEKNFAGINARRMLDLNVIAQKFKDTLQSLTEDVDLEPILKGAAEIGKWFDKSTVTGAALKQIITATGNAFGKAFTAALPYAQKIFKQIIIEALRLEIGFVRLGKTLKASFGTDNTSALDALNFGMKALDSTVSGVLGSLTAVGKAFQIFNTAKETITSIDWPSLGTSIIDGLINGIKAGAARIGEAVSNVANKVKEGFKNALGIHSPSVVFAGFGRNTAQGFAGGMRQGVPQVQRATTGLATGAVMGLRAPSIPRLPSILGVAPRQIAQVSASVGGMSGGKVDVHLNFPNVKDGEGVKAAVASPSFRAELTKALADAMKGAGVPA